MITQVKNRKVALKTKLNSFKDFINTFHQSEALISISVTLSRGDTTVNIQKENDNLFERLELRMLSSP